MRPDEDDIGTSAGNFYFDIVTDLSVQFITITPRMQTGARERIFNEVRSGIQLLIAPHISLADFARKMSYVVAQLLPERNFLARKRRRLRDIFARHPHSKPPK